MSQLSDALDLPFTFVDAISTKHSVVPWILERLLEDQTTAKDLAGGLEMLVPETKWGRAHDRTWYALLLSACRLKTCIADSSCAPYVLQARTSA